MPTIPVAGIVQPSVHPPLAPYTPPNYIAHEARGVFWLTGLLNKAWCGKQFFNFGHNHFTNSALEGRKGSETEWDAGTSWVMVMNGHQCSNGHGPQGADYLYTYRPDKDKWVVKVMTPLAARELKASLGDEFTWKRDKKEDARGVALEARGVFRMEGQPSIWLNVGHDHYMLSDMEPTIADVWRTTQKMGAKDHTTQ